jgi:phosphatidylserine/phosphatidylglycerophosphate/cardiolipin synthase-like enzyme
MSHPEAAPGPGTPAPNPATASPTASGRAQAQLVLELLRPYRGWLILVLVCMLIETAISLAAPWPLKLILDNVVGTHKLHAGLLWLRDLPGGHSAMGLALIAAFAAVLIAALGAVAGYFDGYYTESVAQYVANDLREGGVKVHILARPPHTLKQEKLLEGVGGMRIVDDVGIQIHKLKHLKLHGKMLLADGLRATVGSINLAPGSFDDRRELAIEVDDDDIVDRLHKIAHHDWKHSHPLDLSDEGLVADLEKRGGAGVDKLVLDTGRKGRKSHEK